MARGLRGADVDDVVQEALLRAVQADDLRKETVGSYLAVIVGNLITDRWRAEQRVETLRIKLRTFDATTVDGPDVEICEIAQAQYLYRRLDRLLPKERAVLLRIAGGRTRHEIAEELHLTLRAVDSSLLRARRKMRDV